MRFLHGAWGSFLDFLASTCTHYEEVLFNVRGFIRESFGWWDCATWMHNAR
jgi:hypothetical protein